MEKVALEVGQNLDRTEWEPEIGHRNSLAHGTEEGKHGSGAGIGSGKVG